MPGVYAPFMSYKDVTVPMLRDQSIVPLLATLPPLSIADESAWSVKLPAPLFSIFESSSPATPDAGDASSVILGLKFTADRDGSVAGVRFYKSAANTGTHVGALWAADGTPLRSATFSSETASGWQTVLFSTPVAVTAGTTYVVSYLAPNGHYAAAGGAFSFSKRTTKCGVAPRGRLE